jgi:hypothetical protein
MYNIYFIIRTVTTPETAVLGIRNVYPGSGIFFILDPTKTGGKQLSCITFFVSFLC